ncbi:gamma-glutamylcyclotransferase [Bradyrhizobium sp. 31Argb]|uniref:gamma-glutamylcyclotransferase n=1 Tax=unclassified Bradyrhizobium TaxID=2631580 RepID=UPI00102ECFB7|nr:gamma-glutamylcyclotransferase [Bradyrhizobium sp. Leo170]TAI65662.1 gamma-glutamylcyclotransferase [Bradyrhizobium sp. Leo170]
MDHIDDQPTEVAVKLDCLTRDLINTGVIDAIVARDAPTVRILSEIERQESLLRTLAAKPRDDVWLFGYGSLVWNPTIHFVERRVAQVLGWHRAFCLATPAGRGSLDNPGLVLGLDEGGHCDGVAFRISGEIVESELAMLWKREMLSSAYVPRWLDLLDEHGERFGCGIAFTIDPACEHYDGGLEREHVVRRLATASGALGSSADYLFRTCEGLHEHGIHDEELERLRIEVAAVQSAREG